VTLLSRILIVLVSSLAGWNGPVWAESPRFQAASGTLDAEDWDFEKSELPLRGGGLICGS
jgi:hypothetical protein